MDLLAADLAARSGTDDGPFPTARLYDPYFSHSWASGFSPFADGNNQESSSEAVNAWNGLALWAQATKDPALETEARWMLSGETASALAYWVAPDLHDPAFAGFDHDMVSLNWGAKRDFATWFSPDPNAVVAIQLVPMGPVSGYLGTPAAGGSAQIHRLLAAAAPHGYAVTYGDYLLMYRSLAGVQDARAALRAARTLPAKAIDDGDSRTYLLAYLMARSAG
jgi:endoglucanase Acf2